MKVLVTGHKGYIGSHLVPLLMERGHHVTGCDLNLYSVAEWEKQTAPNVEIEGDFRALEKFPYDAVLHLAAISNDPMGNLDPKITRSVNYEGTVELARKAKAAGVKRFLFAGSCSIYGRGSSVSIDETGEVAPLTAYSQSKIDSEKSLLKFRDDHFLTLSLRNATAYGHSPVLRIDLVVNNFLGSAMTRGDIRVMSDGTSWRPLIHCYDIARAFVAFLEAPEAAYRYPEVNVGSNKENYQVRDVLKRVEKLVPEAHVVYTGEVGNDPRNYRVNFDRLKEVLPNFSLRYTLDAGINELANKYRTHGFSKDDFAGGRFVRLRILKCVLKKLHCQVPILST